MNSFSLFFWTFYSSHLPNNDFELCLATTVLPDITQKRRFLGNLIKASILVRLQAPYYAIGLSKAFAIEFDNVIAEVEKSILNTSTSLDAIIVLVHSSSLGQYLCPQCKTIWNRQLLPEQNSYRYEILHVNTLLDSL